jgi:hypothetical protein
MLKHEDIFELLKCRDDVERLSWIESLLKSLAIEYVRDNFPEVSMRGKTSFSNLYLPGTSNRMIIAHYDTVRPEFCANDNTASVINALILKQRNPQLNVAILDGEEAPYLGIGSRRLSKFIKSDYFPEVKEILNLELTGVGRNICIGQRQKGNLKTRFKNYHEINVPFSDSDMLDREGIIDNVVMFLLPDNEEGKPDHKYIYYCHTPNDHPGIIKVNDMKWFTDEYLEKFLITWL